MDEVEKLFLTEVVPIIFTQKLLGLFPYKLNKFNKFILSPLPVLYSLLIFLFSIYNLLYTILWCEFIIKKNKINKNITEKVYLVYKTSESIIFLFSFIISLFITNRNFKRFNKMIEVGKLLYKINVKSLDEKTKYYYIKRYIIITIILIIIFIADYYILLIKSTVSTTFLSWITGNMIFIYNSLLMFHFTNIIYFFTQGFININNDLKNLDKKKRNFIKNDNNKIIWITAKKRIIIFIYAHDMYIFFIEDWNKNMGFYVILTIIANVIALTGHLYYTISEIIDLFNGIQLNYYHLIYSFYWILLSYSKIIVMISNNVQITEEVSIYILFL